MAVAPRWVSTLRTIIPGSVFSGLQGPQRAMQMALASGAQTELPPAARYSVLRWYYQNNALYDRLSAANFDQGRAAPAIKGLRNPAYRIVEFYPAMLWPGDLPNALPLQYDASMPQSHTEALSAAIRQVWQWSNWAQGKQTFARWLPMLGDMFLKVVQPKDSGRVYFELIDPAYVTDFDEDSRGNVIDIRVDIPREDRSQPIIRRTTHVERWSKASGTYQRWTLPQAANATATLDLLPEPEETIELSEFGIDFVPFVHCRFLDVGELRGCAAFLLQLDKIDNLNMEATRLAQLLYRHNRKSIAVSANDHDSAGRAGAGLTMPDATVTEDDEIMLLPGAATASTLLPGIDFAEHRQWILDGIRELQADSPELAYWQIADAAATQVLSGIAIRLRLGPAIAKLLEVRGRAEDALARADMMALSLGQVANLPLFRGLGDYHSGALDHCFAEREVIPLSEKEDADTKLVNWQTAVLQAGIGVTHGQILREQGYSDEQITAMQTEQATTGIIPTVAQ